MRVVELGGPMDDKFDACAHESNCHSTVQDLPVVQIENLFVLHMTHPQCIELYIKKFLGKQLRLMGTRTAQG